MFQRGFEFVYLRLQTIGADLIINPEDHLGGAVTHHLHDYFDFESVVSAHRAEAMAQIVWLDGEIDPGRERLPGGDQGLMLAGFAVPSFMTSIDGRFHAGNV